MCNQYMQLTSTNNSLNVPVPVPESIIKPSLRLQTYNDKKCIESLSYMLIRPPRVIYNPCLIRNPRPVTYDIETHMIPFELTVYSPKQKCRYCILYMHGNSSSRMEGMTLARDIPPDVALACFDFSGCGNGSEQWVTLGLKQSIQVNASAAFLEEKGFVVVGWGRSMGAVSLLLSNMKIMVSDSAFCCLKQLCTNVASSQVKWMPNCLFNCLFSCVYRMVRNDVYNKTHQHIQKLSILDHLRNDQQGDSKKVLFISGDDDSVVDSSHSLRLYQAFRGNKEILIFQGTHNSQRKRQVLQKCFDFIDRSLNQSVTSGINMTQTGFICVSVEVVSQIKLVPCPMPDS